MDELMRNMIGERHESIGVFVWTKFSAMDRATPSGTFDAARTPKLTATA